MIEALEADPAIDSRFQFWTFGYSTGDPIPYSAHLLRRDLDEVRQKFDPGKKDPAFDRMVVIGHSMGGLVVKMIAVDSGDRLWRVISDHPFRELVGSDDDRNLFHSGLIFGAREGVRRVVYIATPHQGSRLDRGSIQRVGTRLIPRRTHCVQPTIGWSHGIRRTFSTRSFARLFPPASTSWNGARQCS